MRIGVLSSLFFVEETFFIKKVTQILYLLSYESLEMFGWKTELHLDFYLKFLYLDLNKKKLIALREIFLG